MPIAALLNSTVDAVRSYAGSLTWAPLVGLSRTSILSLLQRIQLGKIVVHDCNGTVTVCGAAEGEDTEGIEGSGLAPSTELRVRSEAFWVRLLLFADMGFAESYMLGEFTCSDLVAFFQIFILNRSRLSNATTLFSSLSGLVSRLARQTNTLPNALLNISAHYDISNAMFAAFLSPDMTYSCPIWASTHSPKAATETLEQAQQRKLHHFIAQARIKSTDHVLEIGTGWGSFAIAAVRTTGCRVTSLTLSREQKALADERIARAGATEHIEVLLCDYRALPTPREGRYDKVVSIEMLEAVGREFLDTYFACVDKLLKPDGGIAVFQCITMPETRYDGYASGEDFIRKYIFPGGHLPTISQLVASIHRGSAGTLIVDSVRNIGGHYARTLRLWRQSFEANFDTLIRPSLLAEHDGMTEHDVQLFRRKWEYYFTYCEAGFNTKTLGDVIITVGREGAMELLEGIPL